MEPQPVQGEQALPHLARDTVYTKGSDMRMQDDFQTSLADMMAKAKPTDAIIFNLPKSNAVSGLVLQHAIKVVERLFSQYDPMIWKVGFTHCPSFRWNNETYGYKFGVEKWAGMVVLYASLEPYSPAMLEATLIEKFNGA